MRRARIRSRFGAISLSVATMLTGMLALARPAFADSPLCNAGNSSSFSVCINAGYTAHDYENHYTSSYWSAYAGHNCTNYVGYMLTIHGESGHGPMGNATSWDDMINAHPEWGYTVNATPAIGSIAQWDYANGGTGHVAYVEAVNGNSITISEDNAPPYNSFRWRIVDTGGDWPNHFLHIKDMASPPPADTDGDGTPDISDALPNVRGLITNRGAPIQPSRLSGDFDGDGNQDLALFYNQGNLRVQLYVFKGNGSGGFAWPQVMWDSGTGTWDWRLLKPVVGDFNGDGKDDIAVLYDMGGSATQVYLFKGTTGQRSPGQLSSGTQQRGYGIGSCSNPQLVTSTATEKMT